MKHLVVVLATLFSAAQLDAGLSYRIEQITEGVRTRSTVQLVKSEGGKSRMQVVKGDSKLFGEGAIVLTSPKSHTITVVDMAKKTYSVIDLDQLSNAAANLGKAFKQQMPDPIVTVTREGDGGIVEGFPTQRWRMTVKQDLKNSMTGIQHLEMTTQMWTTDKLAAEDPGEFDSARMSGGPLMSALEKARSQIKGFPLKMIATTKVIMGGSTTTQVMRTNISEIRRATFPPASFEVPPGYKKVDSPIDKLIGAFQ